MIPTKSSLQGVCLSVCVCVCVHVHPSVCLCMYRATGKWRKEFRPRWWPTKKNLHAVSPKGFRDKMDRWREGITKSERAEMIALQASPLKSQEAIL